MAILPICFARSKSPVHPLAFSYFLLLVLLQGVVHAQNPAGDKPPDTPLLEQGNPIERSITGQEKHGFLLTLSAGQMAVVDLENRGLNATITLTDPAAEVIITYAADPGKQTIDLVAETEGRYRLDIQGKSADGRAASFIVGPVKVTPAPEKELWRHQARRLSNKSNTLLAARKYDEALVAANQALALREKALGPESVGVANSFHMLGNIHNAKGNYSESISNFLLAGKVHEKISGPVSEGLFITYVNLGGVYYAVGNLEDAELFLAKALNIKEKLSGPEHPFLAYPLNNLSLVYQKKGDFIKAKAYLERALVIKEKAFGVDHNQTGTQLMNLGSLSEAMGDFVLAESFGRRALAVFEKTGGPEDPLVIDPLINLGNVYYETGDLSRAETMYRRAFEVSTKTRGLEHPTTALAINNLAEVKRDRREFAEAEKLFQQALAIVTKRFGENHSNVAFQLNSLGSLYRAWGDHDRAEPIYLRALSMREKLLGPDHPDVVGTLSNLALLQMARGKFAEAAALQSKVIDMSERNIALNLASGSERQKLAYLDMLAEQVDRSITLSVAFLPDNLSAGELAVSAVLQRKGRVQDELSGSSATLRHQLNPADAELLDRFNKVTSRLSGLVLGGPRGSTAEAHQKQISDTRKEREDLESEISRRSVRFRSRSQSVTLERVQAAVPENAALVEIAAYHRIIPTGITVKERRGEMRYVAYIIRRRGEVRWKDLGEAKLIDQAVEQMRGALRDPQRKDTKIAARDLDEKVMRPLRSLAGDATHLLVSPDGALNLIPFEAFVNERGKYLVENYSISYLTAGRDLLRTGGERQGKNPPLIVANPAFGQPSETIAANTQPLEPRPVKAQRRSVTSTRSIADTYFAPLSGTAIEAETIKVLFPNAVRLTDQQATESSVKRAEAPSILHLATHGFFLTGTAANNPASSNSTVIPAGQRTENPLVRSGLALAGANERSSAGEDGILTALEASGLDLWGTNLVVLSACDTGIGEVRNGEGVYGLRRSFVLAGAESVVMSLWPVSDYVTRELMTGYYRNLKQGLGRGESLRRVRLEMIKRPNRRHPFYWASFIQSGEWANLDGKR